MYMLSSICVHLMKMESICFDFLKNEIFFLPSMKVSLLYKIPDNSWKKFELNQKKLK